MANVHLAGMNRRQGSAENVRMGPVALFTLMAILCLSVLAVLAIATANATRSLSERRADATTQLYLDETAAQTFVATLEGELADGTRSESALMRATSAAEKSLPADSPYDLTITSNYQSGRYTAQFDCGNGRQLDIALSSENDGTLRVEQWRMMTVVNDEPTMGDLFGGF